MTSSPKKVIIAVAGLGGPAAASFLVKAGFDVEIYKEATTLGEIGTGIQQSANAMHVMRHLGSEEELRSVAFEPPTTQFRLYSSVELLQELSLAERDEERHGSPNLQMHHDNFNG